MNPASVLATIPDSLKLPLFAEYNLIIQAYLEHRWTPAELSAAKFCEIVYTILDSQAKGSYAPAPSKPSDMVSACRALESNKHLPRSFRILIPRILPSLYEIRNNRNVGHVGGDVDPNPMDAYFAVTSCSWILGEMVRVLHNVSIEDAQGIVDSLTSRKTPFVWDSKYAKRILNPRMLLKDQILLLTASSSSATSVEDLRAWIECKDRKYFGRNLRELHTSRMIDISPNGDEITLLPPGTIRVENLIKKYTKV